MPPEEPTETPAATPAPESVAAPAVPALQEATILTPVDQTPVIETIVEPVAEKVAEPVAETPAEPEKPAEEKPASHTDTPTLLETAGKDAEKPKTDEKPATEGEKPAAEAVEVTKYEPFVLPEGLPIDEARIAAFTEIVGPGKMDQVTAQKLVDLHTGTMTQFRDELLAAQHTAFAETRKSWVAKIKADPVLGGSGFDTAVQAAARMRDLFVPEAHRAEFEDMLRNTGAGDHPAMIRMMHTAARLFDEPTPPPIQARPVPDRGPAKPTRGAAMYDHPSSRKAAGR